MCLQRFKILNISDEIPGTVMLSCFVVNKIYHRFMRL